MWQTGNGNNTKTKVNENFNNAYLFNMEAKGWFYHWADQQWGDREEPRQMAMDNVLCGCNRMNAFSMKLYQINKNTVA